MQEQITKVAEDIQEVLKRFPEFDEVSLAMITVQNFDDQGGTITSREPSLTARRDDGDWLTYEDSEEVHTMNNLIDWSAPTRELLSKMGLRKSSIVFSREDAQPEMIVQKFAERLERGNSSSMLAGM